MAAALNHFRNWAGLLFLLLAFSTVGRASPPWFTRVWQIDDGLLDNDINGITQGPDHYLWLVTPVGLMQFDGINFSPFPTEQLDRQATHIRIAFCGRGGILWLAFDGGKIIGLNPDFSRVSLGDSRLPGRSPLALADDRGGALWLGYPGSIYRLKAGRARRLTGKDGVPPGNFHCLSGDGAGDIWLAKGNQVGCFVDGTFRQITSILGVQCMGAARTNAVWVAANCHLISCDVNGKVMDCGAFQSRYGARATAVLEDRNGAVWIGTDGSGLFHYNVSGFTRVRTSHSTILSLAQDDEGNIWVGTGGGGLDRISPGSIQVETLENDHIQSQIQSICQDDHGDLWGATRNGSLVRQIGGNWIPVFTNASFAGMVNCVAAGRSGGVWAGTRDGELLKIVKTNCIVCRTNIARGTIRGLFAASKGDLWIVGNNALERWNNEKIENVRLPPQVRGIYAITEDAAGNIWVGGNSILLRWNGNHLVNESSRVPISRHPICCLYGTSDGSLWIGSRGGGLIRLNRGRASQIGLKQGLVGNYISQIVADGNGWLWFASNHGIFKLRQREIERAMDDHSIVLRPFVYGKNEGLISKEAIFSIASPYVLPHAFLGQDGRVWMLTHSGIVVADATASSHNPTSPPVLLTQVAVDGLVIASHNSLAMTEATAVRNLLTGPLKIAPSHRHLEFDFTGFHFRAPENLYFRYQLGGYDNGWIDAGAQRGADYSRLSAGHYQFRVEASVGDGPWSEPATVDLDVMPFFWQTWWFRTGAVLIFSLCLIAIVRYVSYRRLRLKLRAIEQQAAVERERGRIARDIHDDLGNRLTEIQLLSGLAERNGEVPNKAMTQIHEISSAARQATDALDEIVWAINPRNDTLPHLMNYLGQFANDFMRTAGIQCRVDLPENPPVKAVSAEVRHNLFLAIKESLSNIARHSNATAVTIRIQATDRFVNVLIQDNGRGFSGNVKGNGADGLENMRLRIAEIGGQFKIESSPGAGTRISFNGLWLAKV